MRTEKELEKRIKDLCKIREIKLKEFNKYWKKKKHSYQDLVFAAEVLDTEFSPIDNELATLFWILGMVDSPDVESVAELVTKWTKKR